MLSKVTFFDKDFLQKLILDLLKCYTVHLSKQILVVLFMKQTAIINDETVRRLVVTKRLKEKEESINSLDFSPDGLVLATASDEDSINIYSINNASLKFSPCGNMIMLTTFDGNIYLLDGLHGNLLHTLSDHVSDGSSFLEASFTKDSAYVFAGSCDGNVYVWKTDSGSKYIAMCGPNGEGIHSQPVRCLRFNPKYWLMVTASSDLLLLLLTHNICSFVKFLTCRLFGLIEEAELNISTVTSLSYANANATKKTVNLKIILFCFN
ncbi:WD repeat-containing protein 82 [Trichinella spiralis]|uniref:WD repeat-containing protein 82 n=1 Tax=Trichinella spiralis TaxID=6334 RepID=UPI0001EFB518|nr:WD repeat-containing protein 82 [Trichinella spiralis]